MVPEISITSIERVFPKRCPQESLLEGKSVILSLLDATAADFSDCSAIWFLEPPSNDISATALASRLREALSMTLDAYAPWCGHLKPLPYNPQSGHRHVNRFGRLQLSYESPLDPGVELIIAHCPASLDVIILPNARPAVWNMHEISLDSFVPHSTLASPFNDSEDKINPSVAIQVTHLKDNSAVIAIKMAHPLGDAHTLARFTSDWARISKAILEGTPLPALSPVLDPAILDQKAAGDIEQPIPDPEIIKKAESLPLHRYDWWAPSPGCPWPKEIPAPFRSEPFTPAGKPLPWSEWDVTAPVSYHIIHLTGEQCQRIWETATSQSSGTVSRHDAIVAHIWSCINRARGLNDDDDGLVHCDLVCGMRGRLALGEHFLGSATIMIDIAMKGSAACSVDIGAAATAIRSTLAKIDEPGLRAHLHSVAYEKSPQRIWQAFLGTRHILVTSWVHAGVYDLDFGGGLVPRYVEAIMPNLDGLVELKEAPPNRDTKNGGDMAKPWTRSGVDISLHLRSDTMERLLQDSCLLP
ncbi:hypothetical protein CVT26_012216 [Gymnopilus dilepis]|uniref:Transferase family protein n=1 Tax=Gymnopilus dilepis TaxID=231916 RepID=A0A409YQ56_9AGAR|nr:hypothetical protein CVT26_012216 [Gymnopilus dilepis]